MLFSGQPACSFPKSFTKTWHFKQGGVNPKTKRRNSLFWPNCLLNQKNRAFVMHQIQLCSSSIYSFELEPQKGIQRLEIRILMMVVLKVQIAVGRRPAKSMG